MMRVICLLLVSTFALKVTAQQYTKFNGYGFKADRIWADSISIQPNDTIRNKAARSIAVIGSTLYIANGTKWNAITGGGGGSTDTTSLSNRIDARVPYTGATTAVDLGTNNITARDVIPTRRLQLGIAASSVGTARFLNDQNSFQSSLISNVPASNINIYLPTKSDTLAVKSDVALKLNIADTASMLTNYIRAAGFGLTKSSQSLLVDSFTLSTRAWRQKGLDSLAAIELNVSDTNVFSRKLIQTNRQTASYTLALTDLNQLVEINNASANTLTVPLNNSIAFAIGSKIDIVQYGAGQTTITATSGVTIRSYVGALKIAGQYGACTLVKIGTNEWYCFGNLSN